MFETFGERVLEWGIRTMGLPYVIANETGCNKVVRLFAAVFTLPWALFSFIIWLPLMLFGIFIIFMEDL